MAHSHKFAGSWRRCGATEFFLGQLALGIHHVETLLLPLRNRSVALSRLLPDDW